MFTTIVTTFSTLNAKQISTLADYMAAVGVSDYNITHHSNTTELTYKICNYGIEVSDVIADNEEFFASHSLPYVESKVK